MRGLRENGGKALFRDRLFDALCQFLASDGHDQQLFERGRERFVAFEQLVELYGHVLRAI